MLWPCFDRFTDDQINYAKQKSVSDFNFDIGRITKNIVVTNANQFRNEKLMTLTHLTAEAMRFDHVYLAINKVLRGKTNAIGFQGSDLNWSRLQPIVTSWSDMGFSRVGAYYNGPKFKFQPSSGTE